MKVWATFKEGTRLYRAHFGQLFVLNAITFLPAAIIAFAISREAMPIGNSQEAVDRWAALTAVLVGAMMLWGLVSTATLHYAIGDAYQTGRCNWRESLSRCRPRLPVFAGTMGVLLLVGLGVGAVIYMVSLLSAIAGLILLVAAVLVGAFGGATFFTILVPVVVREDVGVRDALKRTWHLIRPKLLTLVGLMFVSGFLIGICNQLMTNVIDGGFQATVTEPTQMLVAMFASIVVPTLVFTPWTVSVVTMAYIRLREDRGESLDRHTPTPSHNPPHIPAMEAPVPGDGQVAHPYAPVPAVTTSRSIDDEVLALLQLEEPTPGSQTALPADEPTQGDTNQAFDDEILALLQLEEPVPGHDEVSATAAEPTPAADPSVSLDDQLLALLEMDAPNEPAHSRPRWSEPLGSS